MLYVEHKALLDFDVRQLCTIASVKGSRVHLISGQMITGMLCIMGGD